MAGMKALGRVLDVVPNASGVGISLKNASGIAFVAVTSSTGSATLAFTAATSYGGSYVNATTASGFGQPAKWYQRAGDSTNAWTEQAASWSTSTLTIGATSGYASYVDFLVSELADTYPYIKVTGTNLVTGCLTAILYDLTVQRKPANLAILSA